MIAQRFRPRTVRDLTTALLGTTLVGALLVAPCVAPAAEAPRPRVPQAWRDRHELAILEAAIRQQLAVHGGQREIVCFCVGVQRTIGALPVAPTAALLARFKRQRPPVRPPAACHVDEVGAVTTVGARPALSIVVGPIYWNREDRASIDVVWRRDVKNAVSASATFVLREGRWTSTGSAAALSTVS